MPNWTDQATVKIHIQVPPVNTPRVFNERVELINTDYSELKHRNLDADSVVVKQVQLNAPYTEAKTVTLSGSTDFQLTFTHLSWDSVVVASDSALSTLYTEFIDYVVDYTAGTIRRTETLTSSIPDGGTVHMWYLYFNVFTEGSDYDEDLGNGRIRRTALTSTIENESAVRVDYSHSDATPTDQLIDQAILEAEGWMEERLASEFTTSSTDQGLQSAATFLTLAIVANDMSFRESIDTRDEREDVAKRWMELAQQYWAQGLSFFGKFSRGLDRLDGGLIQKRNHGPSAKRSITNPTITVRQRKR